MSKQVGSVEAGEKDECPFCLERVVTNPNCFECMTCHQKMHGICNTSPVGPYNPDILSEQPGLHKMVSDKAAAKGDARLLKDDILTCPVCSRDSIANCDEPGVDLNKAMKEAVAANPMAKGGRRLKRQRKSRKTRKNNRRTRNKKSRKSKLRRKR